MSDPTKIAFRHRQVRDIDDVTDLVVMLFPGNRNQQHAAARILLELKAADDLVPTMAHLERRHNISRRTLQRARAKLAKLGLIERISWMNTRYHGREGWKLSTRFSATLRALAGFYDTWQHDREPVRQMKDEQLTNLLEAGRLGGRR
ncbi:MAG: helix-turn-helix domain-containing protein [Phycisphaeraceae bacterium]